MGLQLKQLRRGIVELDTGRKEGLSYEEKISSMGSWTNLRETYSPQGKGREDRVNPGKYFNVSN